jgi:hypothetical protein
MQRRVQGRPLWYFKSQGVLAFFVFFDQLQIEKDLLTGRVYLDGLSLQTMPVGA